MSLAHGPDPGTEWPIVKVLVNDRYFFLKRSHGMGFSTDLFFCLSFVSPAFTAHTRVFAQVQ